MTVNDLSVVINSNMILKEVNFTVSDKDKIGLVGRNGNGKSTLLKCLCGNIDPSSGNISIPKDYSCGYLPQEFVDEKIKEITVMDYLLSGRPIVKIEQEIDALYQKIELDNHGERSLFDRIDCLRNMYDYFDGDKALGQLLKILKGMRLERVDLDNCMSTLSGGEKTRVMFARLLYSRPELLLLDEPTNHLDLEAKQWLVRYLASYKYSYIVVSHDKKFLDTVCTKIFHINNGKLTIYNGNFSLFLEQISVREKSELNLQKNLSVKKDKIVKFLNKMSNVSGKKKRQAKSREKMLEKVEESLSEININQTKRINIVDKMNTGLSVKFPLHVENLSFKYPGSKRWLIKCLDFSVRCHEKVLFYGENGMGKTTLIKLLTGNLNGYNGKISFHASVMIGYYCQELEALDQNKTVFEEIFSPDISYNFVLSYLAKYNFTGVKVSQKVATLSPGEKSRLVLAKALIGNSNFLLLDEPTNHLDITTKEVVGDFLSATNKNIILVSHDIAFAKRIGTERVLLFPDCQMMYIDQLDVFVSERRGKNERKVY